MDQEDFFIPENLCPEPCEEHVSPSGKYKLSITHYSTESGCWDYTRGVVYEGKRLIADIRRNYCSFPFSWVENHPKGDFIIAGADYQGQTVVELKTGARRDFVPKEAEEGCGFCWVGHKFFPESAVLCVDGCYWACPYEFKFFDFSDPMEKGWPEIEIEIDGAPAGICVSGRLPEIDSDGVLHHFEVEENEDSESCSCEQCSADKKETPVTYIQKSISLFRREGMKFVRFSEWVSDDEQKLRKKRKEDREKWDRKIENFLKEDPLYLTAKKLLENPAFHQDHFGSFGITYKGWCPDFDKKEQRFCSRIHEKISGCKLSIDLEWAMDTGPVKLVIWVDGKLSEEVFFEHSVDGIRQAFEKAEKVITEHE